MIPRARIDVVANRIVVEDLNVFAIGDNDQTGRELAIFLADHVTSGRIDVLKVLPLDAFDFDHYMGDASVDPFDIHSGVDRTTHLIIFGD